jgi:hypothetical protein
MRGGGGCASQQACIFWQPWNSICHSEGIPLTPTHKQRHKAQIPGKQLCLHKQIFPPLPTTTTHTHTPRCVYLATADYPANGPPVVALVRVMQVPCVGGEVRQRWDLQTVGDNSGAGDKGHQLMHVSYKERGDSR